MYLVASLDGISEFTYCPNNSTISCWDQRSSCIENCINNETYPAAFVYWQELFMDHLNLTTTKLSIGKPMPTRFVPLMIVWILLHTVLIMDADKIKKIVKANNYLILTFGTSFMLVCFLTKGSSSGIRMMFHINPKSLINFSAWSNAIYIVICATSLDRICYMLYGTHLKSTMSSDILSIVSVSFIFLASLICGIVCHSLIGIVMINANINVEHLENVWFDGMSPYFTVFLTGIGFIGVSQLWAVVYFLTCIMIISNNLIVQVDALEMCLSDTHLAFRSYRNYSRASFCMICAIIGLLFSSKEAYLVLKVFFRRIIVNVSSFNLWVMTVVVFWIYGVQRLSDDIHFFRRLQPTRYWKICWYVIPCVMTVPCIYTDFFCGIYKGYGCVNLYYPVSIVLKLPLLICAVYEMFHFLKMHNLLGLLQPEERWGPSNPKERHLRYLFNPRKEIRSRRREDTCEHICLLRNSLLENLIDMENNARYTFIRPLESAVSFTKWSLDKILEEEEEEVFD
ncbi:hypothetical protein RN001_009499 [Aquatica leii]|uniref:Uncharacterized protein n=1 Tax=Aquatica leii TaxID=1421715 RepID=A0AAN7QGD7_9COLE|nr:hypothetical protein RN001_009499 [Aquatica leii]